jgi:hypothetical protein
MEINNLVHSASHPTCSPKGKGAHMPDNRQPDANREGYDPEFEIPDPEQVERDRKEAEKIYGDEDKDEKNPAA